MGTDDDLDRRLRQLADKSEITDIIYQFQHGVDGKDPELILSCLAPDTELDLGDGFVVEGIEHAAEYFRSYVGVKQVDLDDIDCSTHVMANLVISLRDDAAHAAFIGVSYLMGRRAGRPTGLIRGLGYEDEYVRRGGEWRMRKRVKSLKWMFEAEPTFVAVTAATHRA